MKYLQNNFPSTVKGVVRVPVLSKKFAVNFYLGRIVIYALIPYLVPASQGKISCIVEHKKKNKMRLCGKIWAKLYLYSCGSPRFVSWVIFLVMV